MTPSLIKCDPHERGDIVVSGVRNFTDTRQA